MKRVSAGVLSTLVATLMLAAPALACTSDCNLPDVDLTVAEGYLHTPSDPGMTAVVRGVNTFCTVEGKTWQFAGDLVGVIESDIEAIIHKDGMYFTVREWGTITVTSLWDVDYEFTADDTILVRTTAHGDFPVLTAHYEIVGGTGYFASVVGYGDAIVDVTTGGDYTLYIGFA